MPPAGKKFCWSCGAQLQPTARFCPMCGAQQREASAPAPEPAPAPTPDPVPTWEPQPTGQQPLTFVRDDHAARTGAPVSAPGPVPEPDPVVYEPVTVDASLCCPNCRSRDLIPITDNTQNVDVEHQGYSASKGCCGWFLLGPFGLLCGMCGQKDTTTVTNTSRSYWVCRNCGNKFRNLSELEAELATLEANLGKSQAERNIWIAMMVFSFAFSLLCAFLSAATRWDGEGFAWAMLLCFVCSAVGGSTYIRRVRALRDELEKGRAEYEDLCRRAH